MNYSVHLEKKNDIYVVGSRVIAKEIGKRHGDVLESLEQISENRNVGSLIIPSTYKVKGQNREYKEYLLTKDGFTLYMFNIQGYLDFKMAYINEFNRMEQALKQPKRAKLDFQEEKFIKTTWKGQPVMEVIQLAKYINIGQDTLHWLTKNEKQTLRFGDLRKYKEENYKTHSGNYSSISILFKKTVIEICKKYGVYEKVKHLIENYFRVDNRLEDKTFKVPTVPTELLEREEDFSYREYERMKAEANSLKRRYLSEVAVLQEKIKKLDATGLTSPCNIYAVGNKVYVEQDL